MDTQTPLQEWLDRVADALDTEEMSVDDRAAILDVVRQVAHGVYRPAGPLAAYLMGTVVGRGGDLRVAAATVADLVADWQPGAGPEPAAVGDAGSPG